MGVQKKVQCEREGWGQEGSEIDPLASNLFIIKKKLEAGGSGGKNIIFLNLIQPLSPYFFFLPS